MSEKTKAPKAEAPLPQMPPVDPYAHIPLAIQWFNDGPSEGHDLIAQNINDGTRTLDDVLKIMCKGIVTTCTEMCPANCECPQTIGQINDPEFRQFLTERLHLTRA